MDYINYLQKHNKSGLKVGDIVRILRKAKNHENGWNDIWITDMNIYVNRSGIIIRDNEERGFMIDFKDNNKLYVFPYFILTSRKDKIKKILE